MIRARLAARVALGLGEDVRLLRASRAQGNFTEYAPLTLLLLLLLEAAGSGPALLHLLGGRRWRAGSCTPSASRASRRR
ncbi:MAPEG family protein [Teichococcus aestuarii]|uniref:MAPEG family protein n=1 Tax=Teichococcus aestuarii TaxID=568898 RepID=UPI0036078FFA